MDGLRAVTPCGIEDAVDPQITFRRRAGTDAFGLIGHPHMQGRAVGIGIDRDARDSHLAQGANDADGDLAAVGDQNFAEHRRWNCSSGHRGVVLLNSARCFSPIASQPKFGTACPRAASAICARRSGSAMSVAIPAANASAVSPIQTLCPCSNPSPAQPDVVETTARRIAIASSTFTLVPAETVVGTSTRLLSM